MKGKRLMLLKYAILLFSIFLCYQAVEAHDKGMIEEGLYESTKRDVTGDKRIDIIELKGTTSAKKSGFLKNVHLLVESHNKTVKVPLESGYNPKLTIADFNKDGVKDVFVSVHKSENEAVYSIFTFKNNQVAEIPLPPSAPVIAQFQDYYMTEIKVGKKSLKVDVSQQRDFYEERGVYSNGRLNEATELIVEPFSELKPSTSLRYRSALTAVQEVKGLPDDKGIANIMTTWSYENGDWVLKKVVIKKKGSKDY